MSGVRKSYKMIRAKRRISNSRRKNNRVIANCKARHKRHIRVQVSPVRKGGTHPGETGLAEIDE